MKLLYTHVYTTVGLLQLKQSLSSRDGTDSESKLLTRPADVERSENRMLSEVAHYVYNIPWD